MHWSRLYLIVAVGLVGFGSSGCGKGKSSRIPELNAVPKPSAEKILQTRRQLREIETPVAIPTTAFTPFPTLREWGVRQTATDSLARIGPAAIPALIDALKDPNAEVRDRAAQALARMGPPARQAVPQLIAALQDPDWKVRRSAARALGQIGPDAEKAVPALIEIIRDPASDKNNPDDEDATT